MQYNPGREISGDALAIMDNKPQNTPTQLPIQRAEAYIDTHALHMTELKRTNLMAIFGFRA